MIDNNVTPFKVVCIAKGGNWVKIKNKRHNIFWHKEVSEKMPGPKENEICIVDRRHQKSDGIYYTVRGYETYGHYRRDGFRDIEDKFESITMERVAEKETKKVSVN